ncbi:MAG TPA: glycosyltransferase, partial [Thermodesulfobacteriota bacterium]|nr:glycosyltransferase [Thermodesulfobacteriota bacterium]
RLPLLCRVYNERENIMSKSNNPLISLIVSVYNISKYLERCLNSIIEQSYKNIEILLVDDGSTDSSGHLCNLYQEKDNRIKVIHKTNNGLSSTRNAGLAVMQGDYVGFVDGDDFIDTYMYETLVKAMLDNEADIVQTGFRHIDKHGNLVDTITFKKASYTNLEDMLYAHFEEKNIHTGVWTKLYKSKLFENIRFIEGHVFEDFALLPSLLNECKRFIVIDGAFYNYVSNPESISRDKVNLNVIKSRLEVPLYVLKDIEKINKNFIEYAYKYICNSSIRGYYSLKRTKKIDKEAKKEYIKKIIIQYEKYFKIYKKDPSFKKQGLYGKIRLYFFPIIPYITYLIIEFKNLIRKFKKLIILKIPISINRKI